MKHSGCGRYPRRQFLGDMGLGFTGLVLNALLAEDRSSARDRSPGPDTGSELFRTPAAENVIWLFMMGGVSHLEGFDPKPALNRYSGMRINEVSAQATLSGDRLNLREFGSEMNYRTRILPL